jgi:hypothetical protein
VAVAARRFASASEARVLAVAADGVRQLLAGCLAGSGDRVTHVLVATQVNRIAVRDDGEHLDTGGWVRLLEYATGQSARVLGKPSPEFFTGAGPERQG